MKNIKLNLIIVSCILSFALGLFLNFSFFLFAFILFYLSIFMIIKDFVKEIQASSKDPSTRNENKKVVNESADEHPIIVSARARLKKKN